MLLVKETVSVYRFLILWGTVFSVWFDMGDVVDEKMGWLDPGFRTCFT